MRKMVWITGILIAAITFWAASPSVAEAVKIGVVDIQRIMRESQKAKDARGMFLMDVEAKRGVLKSKEKKVRAMQEQLKQAKTDKSAEEVKEAREKIHQAVKDLKRLRNDMEEELKKKEKELTRKLLDEIRGVVQDFLKKKKYTLILEKKLPLAFDRGIDITDKIIERYDKK